MSDKMLDGNTAAELAHQYLYAEQELRYENELSYIRENIKQGGDHFDDMLFSLYDEAATLNGLLYDIYTGKVGAAEKLRDCLLDEVELYAEREALK